MPRVARNYQRKDYSGLLARMQQSAAGPASEKKQDEPQKAMQTVQVSPEKRRRDSLMSNHFLRYAYSTTEKRLHDRDCTEVSKIPDTEFEMLPEYSTDLKYCWLCGRRAIVRAGISCDDAKYLDAYMELLRRFGATTNDLYTLIVVNHTQLFQVKQDSVRMRCREDTWMLCNNQSSLSLYHNNYEILENYDRIFWPTFHLQQTGLQPNAFRFLINLMLHYSWPEHVARFQAEALAQKQEQLRIRLRQIPNVRRQKRWSLLYFYYTAADYQDSLCVFCAENGIALKILSVEEARQSCKILHCRVRRWEAVRFLDAAARLKECAVEAADECYAAVCEAVTAPIARVPAGSA